MGVNSIQKYRIYAKISPYLPTSKTPQTHLEKNSLKLAIRRNLSLTEFFQVL